MKTIASIFFGLCAFCITHNASAAIVDGANLNSLRSLNFDENDISVSPGEDLFLVGQPPETSPEISNSMRARFFQSIIKSSPTFRSESQLKINEFEIAEEQAVAAVLETPLPAAAPLLLIGLAAIGLFARKKAS